MGTVITEPSSDGSLLLFVDDFDGVLGTTAGLIALAANLFASAKFFTSLSEAAVIIVVLGDVG